MTTDRTFITNEGEHNLLERFRVLIKDTRLFDVLVAYFYISGFSAIYQSLEKTEKIRILVGINTSKQVVDLTQSMKASVQGSFDFSHAEAKDEFSNKLKIEMDNSEDEKSVEDGIQMAITKE